MDIYPTFTMTGRERVANKTVIGASSENISIMPMAGGFRMDMEKTIDLVEPFAIADVYVSGLAEVEDLGDGDFRFTFYTRRRGELEITARLIMSAQAVPEAMRMTARKVRICTCAAVRDKTH